MRILFFTELYYLGGLYNVIRNLIKCWPKDDELIFLCNENMPGLHEIKEELGSSCKVITHGAGIQRDKENQLPKQLLISKARNALIIFRQYLQFGYHTAYFKRLINQYTPDCIIIINGGYPGGYTCRAVALGGLFASAKKKPIFNYHNSPVKPHRLFAMPELIVDFLIEKSVSSFVTVSKDTDQQLSNRPGLRHTKKRKVIYNGIEIDPTYKKNYDFHNIRDELKIGQNDPVILMLATYEERKGHDFLLRALTKVKKEIPNIQLIVAGHGFTEEKDRVENLVIQYELSKNVHLLGFRKDVPELIRQAQVVAMPSQRNESFGLTIVEAMAQRVPVVATDVGGIPEVLENGKGGYIVPLNSDLFADRIVMLLKDSKIRKSVGDAGYEVFQKRFSLNRMVDEYYQLTRQTDNRHKRKMQI